MTPILTAWCTGPLWMPAADGLLRPVGDATQRFRVQVLGPPRHRFMVGLMTDVQHEGRTGRVRSRQVLGTPPEAPDPRGKP